jgi:uncharacterized membrane protein YeaQ/YmgE (transglycosylase-associated protein family)
VFGTKSRTIKSGQLDGRISGEGEESMSEEFWLGILLSIPVGIGSAVIAPWVQQKIDSVGKRRSLALSHNTKKEFERIKFYKANPSEHTQYLVQVAIRIALITAALGIISDLFFMMAKFSETTVLPPFFYGYLSDSLLFIFGLVPSLIGAILIMNLCRKALSTSTKVRNFEEYKSGLSSILTEETQPQMRPES